jgi:surface-anchored protein
MNKICSVFLASLAVLWASTIDARAHTHVEIVYRNGQLVLLYYDYDYGEYDPTNIVLDVGLDAAAPVPNIATFTNLLGEAGSTTWILPQIENGNLLWLGVGNESLTSTDFTGNQYLTLLSVSGPGHFALFVNDSFGMPVVAMNSRDGVDANDTLTVPLRSHIHCNWAFSAPGDYRVRLMVSGTLRTGNVAISSAPTEYTFTVEAPEPPNLGLSVDSSHAIQLNMKAHPGLNYLIESTTNFITWTPLTNLCPASADTFHTLPSPIEPCRFYRARLR